MTIQETLDSIDVSLKRPSSFQAKIALVGCNAITNAHLGAYKDAGYDVVAFCDLDLEMAKDKRDRFFPEARVTTSFQELLDDPEINVLDLATMPSIRYKLMKEAIAHGKHVLSQKPFVETKAQGEELAKLAQEAGVKIAVNQNARFAPFWLYIESVIKSGIIGDIVHIDFKSHWEYKWLKNREITDDLYYSIIYDYAIHWLDLVATWNSDSKHTAVQTMIQKAPNQTMVPPLLTQMTVQYPNTVCGLSFFGDYQGTPYHSTRVTGTKGVIESAGANFSNQQKIQIEIGGETFEPSVEGGWFNDGLDGAMTELLLAIEENREPSNGGFNNLATLELVEDALKSAETQQTLFKS